MSLRLMKAEPVDEVDLLTPPSNVPSIHSRLNHLSVRDRFCHAEFRPDINVQVIDVAHPNVGGFQLQGIGIDEPDLLSALPRLEVGCVLNEVDDICIQIDSHDPIHARIGGDVEKIHPHSHAAHNDISLGMFQVDSVRFPLKAGSGHPDVAVVYEVMPRWLNVEAGEVAPLERISD